MAQNGALAGLPDLLDDAWALDWSAALPLLQDARSLYVLGRGVGFGVAEEAALKLKETCGLHAEAFSAAEVRHGPMALVGPGFPVLAFAQRLGLSFDILHDPSGEIQTAYMLVGEPESFLIDKHGMITYIALGADTWDSPPNRQRIEALLAAPD